jgi:transposase
MLGRQEFQPQLFSTINLESLIPQNHLLRRIDKILDLSFVREMTAHLYCEDNGRPSIDPELFFRISLITYLYNIPSDRRVCGELQFNLAYKWFCKLSVEDRVPDHSSLTRIRDRMGEETFRLIFERLIKLCIAKKILKANKIMMDGSLFSADASLGSLVERAADGSPKDEEPERSNKGKKLSNETHVSYSDPDSTLAGKSGEPKHLRYKLHETIDRQSRLIIDPYIATGASVEGKVCMDRIDHIERTFNVKIEEMTADRGYGYGVNLDAFEKREIKSFIPNFHEKVGNKINQELFKFEADRDVFVCPAGRLLKRISTDESEKKDYARRYRISGVSCSKCPMTTKCFAEPPKPGARKGLLRNIFWEIQLKTKEREKTDEFRKLRRERQWKMEGVFAEAKGSHSLERARFRGRAKVQIQAYMIAFVQNLKRLLDLSPERLVHIIQNWLRIAKILLKCTRRKNLFDFLCPTIQIV